MHDFTRDGVLYHAFPEHGSFFGVSEYPEGHDHLTAIAMRLDGTPIDEPVDVCCIEDDDGCLVAINDHFGTVFTRSDFFGR